MVFKMAHLFNWEKRPQCPLFESYLWLPKPRENGFSRLNFEVWELQNIVRLASALQVSRGGETCEEEFSWNVVVFYGDSDQTTSQMKSQVLFNGVENV